MVFNIGGLNGLEVVAIGAGFVAILMVVRAVMKARSKR